MEHRHKDFIRIGYTLDTESCARIKHHQKYGMSLLALVYGDKFMEKRIHDAFDPDLSKEHETDRSTYHATPALRQYIERLLENYFATSTPEHVSGLPSVPWALMSPAALRQPRERNGQYFLMQTEAVQSARRDTWQTPQFVCDLVREALGGTVDLDPCSCLEANQRVDAKHFFNERTNGLTFPWEGTVFLNPPYGGTTEKGADVFTAKLIEEFKSGRVTAAITCLNLQSMPTQWFPKLAALASANAIFNKRIPFHGPLAKSGQGTKYASSKNGTMLNYLGPNPERFKRIFAPHAFVYSEDRYTDLDT